MRTTALATGAALAAGLAATATPAAAFPVGCAGIVSVPEAYVCVVSVDPENAVPVVPLTTREHTVTIPAVCAGPVCTPEQPVTLRLPDEPYDTGTVAVLYYDGHYVPFAVSRAGVVTTLDATLALTGDTAADAVATGCDALNNAFHKLTGGEPLAC